MTTTTEAPPVLTHPPGCRGDRVESEVLEDPYGALKRVTRCLDCPASQVDVVKPASRLVPGTPEHTAAWRENPDRITSQLTAVEKADPQLNPRHMNADSDAPGTRSTTPTIRRKS